MISDGEDYDGLPTEQWKIQLPFDKPCGAASHEGTCWLAGDIRARNLVMHGLTLELVETSPGTLLLHQMTNVEVGRDLAIAARETSFIVSWLLRHHPCIQELGVNEGHSQPDSFLNTCVTIVAVLIVITLIVMVIILLKCFSGREDCPRTEGPYNPYSNVSLSCESEDCRDYGSMMRASLISFMEPCEDFYEFICGGWMKAARIPHEEVVYSTMSDVHRRVENDISDILNNTVISYRDQTATQKASALYQGCINIDLRNSKGVKPLEDLLRYFDLGHWPTLNRTAVFRTFFMLGNVIRELGLDAIMTVRVGIDYHNSDRYLVYIGQPSFGVEPMVLRGRFRSPFFRILHRYKIYIYRCALLMGATVAAADVVNEIVAFEAKLAAIMEPPETIHNPKRVYNLMSLRTLEGAIPEIQWTFLLNTILRDVGVSMDLSDHVVVLHPLYLKRLARLLKEVPRQEI
ncbi:neprilysin-1-like [Rhipicephalus microplus]|uniref:neprilysin-1-like n=1 Tax=Rhipicephalus microplus TaxID=6941 RepID=UPI003F6B0867